MEWKRVDKDPPKTEGVYLVLALVDNHHFSTIFDVYNGRNWKSMVDNPSNTIVTHWLSDMQAPIEEARAMVENKDVQTLW